MSAFEAWTQPDMPLLSLIRLGRSASREALLEALVDTTSRLAGCELSQLYLLDDSHTRLTLSAESLDGQVSVHAATSLPSDYRGEQLLQYCLCQNRTLALDELDASLHATGFLPASLRPWRSLLCLPLPDAQGQVAGLLVSASRQRRDLAAAALLAELGGFVINQLRLLQRAEPVRTEAASAAAASGPTVTGNAYGLIGDSAGMRRVYQLLGKVLHVPITVLVRGETGTGKELVARAIHDHGSRRSQPFLVQNCAAMPENLLESELFGYRKGAFSGADRDHRGLFDAADGGTLFLDEIGDMPLSLQAKLLRVLQEGEVRPLGSTRTHRVDVRIIAASHRDLPGEVAAGRFREDLFYRLASFPIELPPLRERGTDLLKLARHFTDKACAFLQRNACRWSEDALAALSGHDFPGNVRELKALVERAVLLCEGNELRPEHLNLAPASPRTAQTLRERLEQVERSLVLDCLRRTGGNQSQAARELGLPRRTLLYRMERLGIGPARL